MKSKRIIMALTAALLLTLPSVSRAVNKAWTTAISSGWTEPTRWTPNGVPTATDSATFNKAGDYTVYFSNVFQDLNNMALSAGTVTFERLASPATLTVLNASGDRSLTVSNATLNLGSSLPVNMNVGNTTYVNGGGTLNLRAGSNLTSYDLSVKPGGAFTVASGSSFTQGHNVLVDGGSFTRPAGAIWTHPVFGTGGSFTAKNNAQVNFGDTVTPNDSNLTVTSGADVAATGAINLGEGSSTMLIDGIGSTLTAGGTSSWTGYFVTVALRNGATVNIGDLIFHGADGNSHPTPNGVLTIESAPSLTTSMTAGNIEIQGPSFVSSDNTYFAIGNGLGQSILTQTGASTLTVGFNDYPGKSTFQVNDGGSYLGGTGGVTINSIGVINIAGGSFATGGAITNNGGTFNFSAGSLSFVGNLAVTDGGLLGANPVLNADRKLTLTGTTTINATRSLTLNGSTFNTGALVVNGTFTFNSGTLGITGAGGLTVGSGGPLGSIVTLGTGRSLNVTQAMTVNAGARFTIDSGAAFTAGSVNNQGELALNGSTVAATVATFSNAGLLRGTGRLTAAVTNLATGIVRASAGEQLKLDGASFVNQGFVEAIGGSASLAEIQFSGPVSNTTANGLIAGANSLLRFAGGFTNQASLVFSTGDNHVFGDVNNAAGSKIIITGGAGAMFYDDVVQNGVFRVSKVGSTTSVAVVLGSFSGSGGSTGGGDIFFEGDLRPGNSAATVNFNNNIGFGHGANLQIEISGVAAGTQYDQVHVTGELSLGGTMTMALVGFNPSAGQFFDVLDWGTLSGTFGAINLPALAGGLVWNTSQLYVNGVVSVVAGLAGDYNGNGTVDAADYTSYRDALGSTTNLAADGNGNGLIDSGDYTVWKSHFGQTVGSGSVASADAAVPEPATLWLLLTGILMICTRQRTTVS